METIRTYCKQLGWTNTDLGRKAEISYVSAYKAVNGQYLSSSVRRKIAQAISQALGESIRVGDIQWKE